jgi:hypothetical protein
VFAGNRGGFGGLARMFASTVGGRRFRLNSVVSDAELARSVNEDWAKPPRIGQRSLGAAAGAQAEGPSAPSFGEEAGPRPGGTQLGEAIRTSIVPKNPSQSTLRAVAQLCFDDGPAASLLNHSNSRCLFL